jgi:hypothetical protein
MVNGEECIGTTEYLVALGGLVVSVLATEPKVRGFDPDGFLRVIKIRSTTSFGGEVKRRSHVVDLRHVKEPYGHE